MLVRIHIYFLLTAVEMQNSSNLFYLYFSVHPNYTNTLSLCLTDKYEGTKSNRSYGLPCISFSFYILAWAAITKYHRLDGFNNKHLSLTVLESREPKIKVANSVPGESCLANGCHLAVFSCDWGEGERKSLRISWYKGIKPIIGAPCNYLPKASTSKSCHIWDPFSHGIGETETFSP